MNYADYFAKKSDPVSDLIRIGKDYSEQQAGNFRMRNLYTLASTVAQVVAWRCNSRFGLTNHIEV
jgi:hypothetical protein